MESHSENQQLVAAENQESDSAAAPGGQQEIQSEPGYRFWPTDEEIIVHYLRRKIADPEFKSRAIPDKEDISSFDPWELYDGRKTSQEHVFFFTKKTIKTNQRGIKMSRVRFGKGGCWNYSGTETWIYSHSEGSNLQSSNLQIGVKETYKFYIGLILTKWNMMEYGLPGNKPLDWVVCRVFTKGNGKVDPPEKLPAASGSSSTAPTENLQHSERSRKKATTRFSEGPVASNNDSSQLNFINTALGSSSMHMYTWPAMLQQDVASMGTVYRSQEHSGERRGYTLNQPRLNMATQQQQRRRPRPVNTHSDEQWQPVNMPTTTLQGQLGPVHPASTMVSTTPYSYSMVNQQQLLGPNLQPDVGSIFGTGTPGWTFNPDFTQPFRMPILQGQYQPAYPANSYNMENQQLPGITTPPILPPDVPVGGNFNPNLTQPDFGSNSSRNRRPRSGNYDQSSVPPQESDSQPSKYRKI